MGDGLEVNDELAFDRGFAYGRDLVGQAADGTRGQDGENDGNDQQDDGDSEGNVIFLEGLEEASQFTLFLGDGDDVGTHSPSSSLLSCDSAIS